MEANPPGSAGSPVVIRRLERADAEAFQAIRRDALVESPFAFGASPSDDLASSLPWIIDALERPDQAVFGAFAPELVGTAGVFRVAGDKFAHKARIWGVYVRPTERGRGFARRLVEAAVAFAESIAGIQQVHLVANAGSRAASLYRSLGFVTWGIERGGMLVDGVLSDEEHMVRMVSRSDTVGR